MKPKHLFFICLFLFVEHASAQTNTFPLTGAAGIGTLAPNASSLLDVTSTTKGILIPRMTLAQRNAVLTPATGLLIYQTDNTPGFYYYSGSAWTAISTKDANTKLSNLVAPTAVNQSLIPRITNSVDMGSSSIMWRDAWLSGNALVAGNIGIGTIIPAAKLDVNGDALVNGITIGRGNGDLLDNTATGYQALYSNSFGEGNTASGYQALYSNNSGQSNTASGYQALYSNSTGQSNTASGYQALYSNTTGHENIANGQQALYYNTTGFTNTAYGHQALYYNSTGSNNGASGFQALYFNTTGYFNNAYGWRALYSNTSGSNNTAYGDVALNHNTTGYQNTATGGSALSSTTTGYDNTANGYYALHYNTTGTNNAANGKDAVAQNTTGTFNTGDGYNALSSNTTGSFNTAVGASAGVTANNLTNATAIGANAKVNASNKVVIGPNIAGMVIGGYAAWSNLSDGRFKENVKENVPGLEFINRLRPVTYTINTKKFEDHIMQNMPDSIKAKRNQNAEDNSKASTKIQTGFVAQEVEKTTKELGYDFDGVNAPKNLTDNYSIAYSQFVVPLVKAVQELSKTNDAKDAKIDSLQKQFNELKALVLSIQQCSPCGNASANAVQSSSITLMDARSLEQNVPNPFTHNTSISYTLPQKFTTAQIMITDKTGKTLRLVNVSGAGKGKLNLDASMLSSGAYNYSLLIDGKLVGTKQMILAK
jgi:hypothetical protein